MVSLNFERLLEVLKECIDVLACFRADVGGALPFGGVVRLATGERAELAADVGGRWYRGCLRSLWCMEFTHLAFMCISSLERI